MLTMELVGKVLPLGDVTSGGQFLEPDGLFSNHIPNPDDKVAMKAITQVVLDKKADLGIIFDTDNSVGEELHLAIETIGHGELKENHWLNVGAYLMESGVVVELRLPIDQNHSDLKGGSFCEYGEAVLKHLENKSESDPTLQKTRVNYEGIRVSGYGGWFLLRLLLRNPVLPLNIGVNYKS
ncbi:putative alpha-D-phosphohexomutase, alpha/beta/alpha domain II [Helianthus anomalus]